MRQILSIVLATVTAAIANAATFTYRFDATPVSVALSQIAEEHPELNISFIYNELENYKTSASVNADNAYEAILQAIGLNPIAVATKDNAIYIEALQHGKYEYYGTLAGSDREPVAAATVLLLAPRDSTVITYGISDSEGGFRIPCDQTGVIAKISCLGYKTTYRRIYNFAVGTIEMEESAVQLRSVTVEADNATAQSDRTIYRPTPRQKNAAQNATDLLRFMAIPQIRINVVSNKVTDNFGTEVALYINGMEASSEDLEGLRTADVRNVEYLEFPTDPRYRGAQRVINFIVQEYAYGGYTKVTANENFMIGLSNKVNVFSKFSYGKMSYDLYVGSNNWDNHHTGSAITGDYRLLDNNGREYRLRREENLTDSRFRQDQYPVTFRATYNAGKVQIRNTAAFTHEGVSANEANGALHYSNAPAKDFKFSRSNPTKRNSAIYAGSFYFALPNDFAIDVTPTFNYSHINDHLLYTAGGNSSIVRNARENAYNYRVNAYIRKQAGQKHSFMAGINGGDIINHLRYTGTQDYSDKFSLAFAAGIIGYNYRSRNLSLSMDAGVCWEGSDINREKQNDVYPWTHINLQYTLSPRHLFSTYFQFASNSPTISQKASDILRDNEYMLITGNPQLENSRHVTLNLAYTWLQSNKFSMSAYGEYYGLFDRLISEYSPFDNGQAILRGYTNNGSYNRSKIGLGARLQLLDGKLELYASPEQYFYKSTGIYNRSYNPFSVFAQATFYAGNFYFQAYYMSSEKSMWYDSGSIHRVRNHHSLMAGWADSNWNVRLSANDVCNRGWVGATTALESEYYSELRTNLGTSARPRINLTATYTINYGRKVQRANEIGEQSGAASAILKY